MSRPLAAWWRCPRCVRVEEKGGAHGVVNTHREGGSHVGRAIVAWLGAGCVSGASALVAGTIPWWREREVGIGLRAGLASVRAIVGLGGDWVACLPFWWWLRFWW